MTQTKAELLGPIRDNIEVSAQNDIRFQDADSSHYVALQAPATVSSNVTFTLPAADGSDGYVLKTDGSGNLGWTNDPAGQWTTSGSNLYFTGGNIGIGDSSPSNPLSVTGASAFNGDVQFTGASYNVTWDKSADDLIFNDNAKAVFGTSSDLQLFHNGTRSKIQNNTGDLRICSDAIQIKNYDDDETYITCAANGEVELYFDNSAKLNTDTDGVNIAGTLHFADDANTHLSRAGADILVITTAGSERLRVDASGNVGIGTSPATILHVKANSGDMLRLDRDNAGAVGNQVAFRHKDGSNALIETGAINCVSAANAASSEFRISTKPSGSANSEKIRVTQAGNVNIGGEFSQTDSKVSILDVTRPIAEATLNLQSSTSTGAADTGSVLRFYGHDGSSARYHSSIKGAKENGTSGNYAGYLAFNTRPNGGSMTERVRVDSTGRLLIGTTTEGEASADNLTIADSGHAGITVRSGTSSWGSLFFSDGTSSTDEYRGAVEYNHNGDYLQLRTAALERLRIDSSGNVGVGTSPDYPLHVANDTEANLCIETNNNSATNFAGLRMRKSRGTHASPTVVASGDVIAQIFGYGYDGDEYHQAAKMMFEVDGTPGNNDMPGRIVFQTTADGGSTPAERLRITNAGSVQLNSDGGSANFSVGASQDFKWYHDANGPTIFSDTNNQGLKLAIKDLNLTEYTGGTTRVKIHSGGNVGIGAIGTPEAKLHIAASMDGLFVGDITAPTSGDEYANLMVKNSADDGYSASFTAYHANGKGLKIYNNGGSAARHALLIAQAGGVRFSVDGDGDVNVNTGNVVIGTSGKGVDFSATASGGTMTSELLDDYEEGSFTLTVTPGSGSYGVSHMQCEYTKVGNICSVHGWWRCSSVNSVSGSLTWSGLPFTARNNTGSGGLRQELFAQFALAASASGQTNHSMRITENAATGNFLVLEDAEDAFDQWTAGNIQATTAIYFNGTYLCQ